MLRNKTCVRGLVFMQGLHFFRAVGRSENLGGASSNPRLFEGEGISLVYAKIWGETIVPPCNPGPTALFLHAFCTVQVWHKIKKVRKAPSKNFNLYICISEITAFKNIILGRSHCYFTILNLTKMGSF